MFFDTYNVCICELESQDSRAHCSHEPPSAAAGHPGREAAGTKQQQQSSSSLKTEQEKQENNCLVSAHSPESTKKQALPLTLLRYKSK